MSSRSIGEVCRLRRVMVCTIATLLIAVTGWFSCVPTAMALPLPAMTIGALFSLSGNRPANLGMVDGTFAPCPTTPNCVNSQSQDQSHAIAPLGYTSTPEIAFSNLQSVLQAQPRVKVLTATDDYIRAEFTLPVVGFVDDVEFYLDRQANRIQVRSASRLGESDLGVNRKRIETIRTKLTILETGS